MAELLIEIGSEEIPARMQEAARLQLARNLESLLKEAGLKVSTLTSYVTPRRLVVVAEGVPSATEAQLIEKKGPAVSAPKQAIDGFLRANQLDSVDALEIREGAKGAIYWAIHEQPAIETAGLIEGMIRALVQTQSWPKSMRFAGQDGRWVRPLTHIIAVFDGKTVEGSLDAAFDHLPFSVHSYGHPILAPEPIQFKNFADYQQKLKKAYVILDQNERRDQIKAALPDHVVEDPALLDEVTGLVEWPCVLVGKIDEAFMTLPPKLIRVILRHHQKYFITQAQDGVNLAPEFVMVSNRDPQDDGKTIIAGNERVLRARLADGAFFLEQDQKQPLEAFLPALEKRVFHAKLGFLSERVSRLQQISRHIAGLINLEEALIMRAALLCKADLSTSMVGEFPELQGYIGRVYAKAQGEVADVYDPIHEHYTPQGPSDSIPENPYSIALGLADRLDLLAGFWLIDEKPTGSKDPFALRRAALGIIRLMLESKQEVADKLLTLNLSDLLEQACAGYAMEAKAASPVPDLIQFFKDRLRVYFKDRGYAYDQIEAVLMNDSTDGFNLGQVQSKLSALQQFMAGERAGELLPLFKRAHNILAAEQAKTPELDLSVVDRDKMSHCEEGTLVDLSHKFITKSDEQLQDQALTHYPQLLVGLLDFSKPLADFFDSVLVNDADPALRRNRLAILYQVERCFTQLADFSKLVSAEG